MIELASTSIAELGAALRDGRARSAELVEQAASNRDESLGAYELWMPEWAAAAAALADAAFAAGLDSPTTPLTAPRLDEVSDADGYRDRNMATLRNTSPGNLLDLCGLSMPAGLDGDGMPIGLRIMAARETDERLVSAGLAVERALGTARERLGTPPG